MLYKKSLPFSKPLTELIAKGYAPTNDVMIFIGNKAWRKGKSFSLSYPERTLALPPWHDPRDYHWPVQECDILIIDTGYPEIDYVNDLVSELYDADASIVRMITHENILKIYNKE